MSVFKRDNGTYSFDFWLKGIRFHGPTEATSESAARKIERAERKKAREKVRIAQAQRSAPMTVNVAFDRFWLEVGTTYGGTYRATVWAALEWMAKEFKPGTLLRDIGPNKITEAIARRRGEGVANATVNRTVTELLRRILRRARKRWEQDGLPEIEWSELLLTEPKERVRELRDHEDVALTATMRIDYMPIIRFALASGMRKRELVSLQWPHIDWTAKTITVHGKGDKIATIPLTGRMAAILSGLRGQHNVFVFTYVAQVTTANRRKGQRYPITYSGLSTAWRRFGPAKAEIEDYRFHDNRHTVATRLLRRTGNLRLVQRLLRLEDLSTTAKYAHADDEDLRAGMELLESDVPPKSHQAVSDEDKKTGGSNG